MRTLVDNSFVLIIMVFSFNLYFILVRIIIPVYHYTSPVNNQFTSTSVDLLRPYRQADNMPSIADDAITEHPSTSSANEWSRADDIGMRLDRMAGDGGK